MWVYTAGSILYPNLYTLLVSPPGVGKSQAISVVHDLWTRTPELKMAPDNVTKASLLDFLEEAKQVKMLTSTEMIQYHSLAVAASEFGVFVPAHDLEFLSALNHIFDNPPSYKETRRTTKKTLDIVNPQLNVIAGTQPAFLSTLLPEAAWGMGFMSRQLLIYSGEPLTVELFSFEVSNKDHRDALIKDLREIGKLFGQFQFDQEAKAAITEWNNSGRQPVPEHSKLAHYNARRIIHVLKLCMVSSISSRTDLLVTRNDFERAKAWLIDAETRMPDIFRAMVLKSDADVLQDLLIYAWEMYNKANKKPIHKSRIVGFLQTKVPAEKILRIIETAELSGLLEREFGSDSLYIPKARTFNAVQ